MVACFQNLTGKSGFDIRRHDGSAGIVTPQSDVNLLALLPHLHSAIPRKIWGTYIPRSKFIYRIFYKRAVSNESQNSAWTHVWYSPPHNGGKFKLPKSMMELFPCLGEFSYQKMLAVTIMQGVNNYCLTLGCQPLAVRETDNKMGKIISARNVLKENKNATMLDFVHAFNAQNEFNQSSYASNSEE